MPDEAGGGGKETRRLMSPRAALSVTNNVVGALLGTTALIFIAKNMGADVLGVLGFGIATIGILSFLSDFGVGSVHIRQMNARTDTGKCIGAYAVIRLALLAVFAIVTLVMIELWKDGSAGGTMPTSEAIIPTLTDTMYVFLVYYVLLGISQIATHTFDALQADAKVHIPAILELVVRVSFVVYIASSPMSGGSNGPALLASAYAAGMISSMLLTAVLMRSYRVTMPDWATIAGYLRALAPVFLVSVIIIIDLYLDKTIVGYFWGEHELGLYFGVQRMAIFVGVFSLSVATLILPSVTTYFIRRDVTASWDVANQAERYVSLVVIPTAAFYLFYGADILRVFLTEEFVAAARTMDLLVMASAVVALVLPLRSVIAGIGKPGTLFMIGLVGVLLQLGLLLVLVPPELLGVEMLGLGRQGAAGALLICSIYYFFAIRYMAWKISRILPYSHSFRHILSAVIMVGVMYVVDWTLVPTVDWIALIVLAIVGVFAYALSSYFMGELEFADYKYFKTMLNPQNTFEYVVKELIGKRGP
ncbi:MAG: polysaccharide biosynthesis C-terminal domain-containing protein [Methanobacteriota archaeon]|nr:MAG: polysaccharide biosynthesis C-terminal domain-containing protein [Euryarchaeota archaeon]